MCKLYPQFKSQLKVTNLFSIRLRFRVRPGPVNIYFHSCCSILQNILYGQYHGYYIFFQCLPTKQEFLHTFSSACFALWLAALYFSFYVKSLRRNGINMRTDWRRNHKTYIRKLFFYQDSFPFCGCQVIVNLGSFFIEFQNFIRNSKVQGLQLDVFFPQQNKKSNRNNINHKKEKKFEGPNRILPDLGERRSTWHGELKLENQPSLWSEIQTKVYNTEIPIWHNVLSIERVNRLDQGSMLHTKIKMMY